MNLVQSINQSVIRSDRLMDVETYSNLLLVLDDMEFDETLYTTVKINPHDHQYYIELVTKDNKSLILHFFKSYVTVNGIQFDYDQLDIIKTTILDFERNHHDNNKDSQIQEV